MKQRLFVLFCLFIQLSVLGQVSDSFVVSGIVCPDKNLYKSYPIKTIKNALVKLVRGDSVLYSSVSNDAGCFYLKCSKRILLESISIEVSALNNQKRVTYDSVCPYQVLKTPSGYQDYSSILDPSKLQRDTIFNLITLQSPLICHFSFELYFQKDSQYPSNYNLDTLCICLNNQYNRLLNAQFEIELQILSLYDQDSVMALNRAILLKDMLLLNYQIPSNRIEILLKENKAKINDRRIENELIMPNLRIIRAVKNDQ